MLHQLMQSSEPPLGRHSIDVGPTAGGHLDRARQLGTNMTRCAMQENTHLYLKLGLKQ